MAFMISEHVLESSTLKFPDPALLAFEEARAAVSVGTPRPFVVDYKRPASPHTEPPIMLHDHNWRFWGEAELAQDKFPSAVWRLAAWNRDKCWHPIYIVCSDEGCSAGFLKRCGSREHETCEPCALRYKKQVRTIVREPMLVARPGSSWFLTLSAPGVQRHCLTHKFKAKDGKLHPSVRCGLNQENCKPCPCGEPSECDCVAPQIHKHGNALTTREKTGHWNRSAADRWNKFITDLRRSIPGFEDFEYFRAVEVQERGAIHYHAVLIQKGATVGFKSKTTYNLLRKYALAHGFGHEVDFQQIGNSAEDQVKAARYVAKYVTKEAGSNTPDAIMPSIDDRIDVTAPSHFLSLDDGKIVETETDFVTMPAEGFEMIHRTWDKKRPRYTYRRWFVSRAWGLNLSRVAEIQNVWATLGPLEAKALTQWFLEGQSGPAPGEQ